MTILLLNDDLINNGTIRVMKEEQPKDESHILDLKQKLNSPNERFYLRKRRKLRKQEFDVQSGWGDSGDTKTYVDNLERKHISLFAKILIAVFIFFVGSLGYAWHQFNVKTFVMPANDVDITIVGPVSIGGGEELSLDILVSNKSEVALKLADLIVEYPEGTKESDDLSQALTRLREGVGDIAPHSVVRVSRKAALFGQEGDDKQIEVRLEYRLEGSNAIFEKQKFFDIALQSSPIRLVVDGLRETTPGQEVHFSVAVSSNVEDTLEDVIVDARLPFGFQITKASHEMNPNSTTWSLENLAPQETKTIFVSGLLEGQNNEERVFKFKSGLASPADLSDILVLFDEVTESVHIKAPFLGAELALNDEVGPQQVFTHDRGIQGRLNYVNNTDTIVRDAEIQITMTGDILDERSVVVPQGIYKSSNNTLLWNENTDEKLQDIAPGETGSVFFNFAPHALDQSDDLFKNPEITFDITITGRRVSDTQVPEQFESDFVKRITFESHVVTDSQTYFNSGPFENTGPLPPLPDQETTYTVVWSLSNSSNQIIDAQVSAVLPDYVNWKGVVSAGEIIRFDPVHRKIVWQTGHVDEFVGLNSGKRAVAFQVGFVPSVNQGGQSPELVNKVMFTGRDTFTGTDISIEGESADISLPGIENYQNSRVADLQ